MNQGLFASNALVSAELPVVSGTTTWAHGLGITPRMVKWVIVCKTPDNGWPRNAEIDVESLSGNVGADQQSAWVVLGSSITVFQLNNGTNTFSLTGSKWKLKCYIAH